MMIVMMMMIIVMMMVVMMIVMTRRTVKQVTAAQLQAARPAIVAMTVIVVTVVAVTLVMKVTVEVTRMMTTLQCKQLKMKSLLHQERNPIRSRRKGLAASDISARSSVPLVDRTGPSMLATWIHGQQRRFCMNSSYRLHPSMALSLQLIPKESLVDLALLTALTLNPRSTPNSCWMGLRSLENILKSMQQMQSLAKIENVSRSSDQSTLDVLRALYVVHFLLKLLFHHIPTCPLVTLVLQPLYLCHIIKRLCCPIETCTTLNLFYHPHIHINCKINIHCCRHPMLHIVLFLSDCLHLLNFRLLHLPNRRPSPTLLSSQQCSRIMKQFTDTNNITTSWNTLFPPLLWNHPMSGNITSTIM
eukprot:m.200812 g.200812  ORF g.200812 m.200812 type:complete len:359 (-) comp16860_c6_seq3:309-1385(-)